MKLFNIIRSNKAEPVRKLPHSGRHRVSELRYVAYAIPEFEAERRFYIDQWKLEEVALDGEVSYLSTVGSPQTYDIRIRKSSEKRIDVIGWEAKDKATVNALAKQAESAGAKMIHGPQPLTGRGGGYGFRFFDVAGITVEVATDFEKQKPRPPAPRVDVPEKLSHIVFHTEKHREWSDFYCRALGFRTSDWLGDWMGFFRCNKWHHRLAVLPGPTCINHISFDVPGVDAVMKGMKRLHEQGTEIGWGPGRHVAGDNVFSYYVTPSNTTVEYTSDLEPIDEASWVARVHEGGHEITDQWQVTDTGPMDLPKPVRDPGLFKAPPV